MLADVCVAADANAPRMVLTSRSAASLSLQASTSIHYLSLGRVSPVSLAPARRVASSPSSSPSPSPPRSRQPHRSVGRHQLLARLPRLVRAPSWLAKTDATASTCAIRAHRCLAALPTLYSRSSVGPARYGAGEAAGRAPRPTPTSRRGRRMGRGGARQARGHCNYHAWRDCLRSGAVEPLESSALQSRARTVQQLMLHPQPSPVSYFLLLLRPLLCYLSANNVRLSEWQPNRTIKWPPN